MTKKQTQDLMDVDEEWTGLNSDVNVASKLGHI